MVVSLRIDFVYGTKLTVKEVKNKIVYYEEIVVSTPNILAKKSEEGHCQTAKVKLNRRVTIDRVPLLV
jgi:hypothetical protein